MDVDTKILPIKRRWTQFRLRTLLILVVLLCLGLGGWQIYWTHFANYVVADPVHVGEPIHVRGQFVDWNGRATVYVVQASLPSRRAKLGRIIHQSGGGRAERSGRWTFRFELEMSPLRAPGEYELELRPMDRPSVFGKLFVLPPDEDTK